MGPMLPAQFARMTSLSAPGVALMTGDWRPHSTSDKRLARRRAPSAATLVLHTEQKTTQEKHTEVGGHVRSVSNSTLFPILCTSFDQSAMG
ncbi:hypothetical protein J4Q44_G00362150, partial [Coregonus suidteri]